MKHPNTYSKSVKDINMVNVQVKNRSYGNITEIYSFRLNVVWDANVVRDAKCYTGQYFIQFLWGTD